MAYIDYYKILGVEKAQHRMKSKKHTVSWPENTTRT